MKNETPDEIDELILSLELEDGSELECEIICIFEYDGNDYAALTPTDDSIEEIYFFGIDMTTKGDTTEFTLDNLEDDDLLEELSKAFDEIIEEEDDEEDSEWDEFINKKLEDD